MQGTHSYIKYRGRNFFLQIIGLILEIRPIFIIR